MPKFNVTLNLPNRPEGEKEIGISILGAMDNGETREVELSILDANYLKGGFGITVEKAKNTTDEAKAEVANTQTIDELEYLKEWESQTDKRKPVLSAIEDRRKQLEMERAAVEEAKEDQPLGTEEAEAEITMAPEHREGGE